MLGIPKHEEEAPPPPQPQHPLSPMGEACSRMDLTAIHQILVNTHYRDDEGSNEVKDQSISVAAACWLLHRVLSKKNGASIAAIVPGMDAADEGHAGS
jgi:hypothetical protein